MVDIKEIFHVHKLKKKLSKNLNVGAIFKFTYESLELAHTYSIMLNLCK